MANLLTNYNNLSDKEKKEYEASVKQLYITMAVAIFLYYLLPFILPFFGETGRLINMFAFFGVYPVFVFIASFLHAKKYDFQILIPSALSIFYLPTVVIFYDGDKITILFAVVFFVMGLFGEFTGHLMLKRSKSKRQPIGLNTLLKLAERQQKKQEAKAKQKKAKKK